ncbi:LysR family transcriptional regulator [Variovorax sp. H27-G14]|uniref:LysR family transcriptional regulator n=1 Tax=Variovorax sp. H27-G14 TaxID=3111914 RepID=UPI0038FC57FF
MIQIEDMQLAAALLREPSLSAAARALDVTPPALSMRLRKLEAMLGLSLASRTARRLSLTPEGERFAREAAALLGQIEGLRDSMQRDDQRLTGTLRIAAPFGYGRQYLAPMLVRFARLHPGLHLQLDLRETPWPDRHDADAVIHIGAVRDSSWVARTLSANERWLCASPDYLRLHGTPRTPREVMAHDCICIRENDEDVTLWHLRPAKAAEGKRAAGKRAAARETLRISPAYVTNDGAVARQWAEQGMGLVLRSEWDAAEAVARGTLVRVLADWQFDSAPVTLLVPNRKGRTARVQAIVGFLVESFGAARK